MSFSDNELQRKLQDSQNQIEINPIDQSYERREGNSENPGGSFHFSSKDLNRLSEANPQQHHKQRSSLLSGIQ